MDIIDCHANIGSDVNNIRKNLFPVGQSAPQLLEKMCRNKILSSVIVPFPVPTAFFSRNQFWYELENYELIQASVKRPLIPFPAVNPGDPASVKNIRTLALTHQVKGVKFSHQIPMNFSIDKLVNHPLMRTLEEFNLPLLLHIGTGKEAGAEKVHTTLNYGVQVAKRHPEVKFIFCHLGRLHQSILDALQLPNVWFDTAAISMHVKWQQFIAKNPLPQFRRTSPEQVIEDLVHLGYEDKIIFGSDEPYAAYEKEIAIIQQAEISRKAKEKIFAGNLRRVVDI